MLLYICCFVVPIFLIQTETYLAVMDWHHVQGALKPVILDMIDASLDRGYTDGEVTLWILFI